MKTMIQSQFLKSLIAVVILLLAWGIPQAYAQESDEFAPQAGPSATITKVKAEGTATVLLNVYANNGKVNVVVPIPGKYVVTAADVRNNDKENVAKELAKDINAQLVAKLGDNFKNFVTTDGNGKLMTKAESVWSTRSEPTISTALE